MLYQGKYWKCNCLRFTFIENIKSNTHLSSDNDKIILESYFWPISHAFICTSHGKLIP